MTRKRSIAGSLVGSFFLLAAFSILVLLIFVVLDFDHAFDTHYRRLGLEGLAFEVGDHVIIPFVVLLIPMMLTMPWRVRRALVPLNEAADRIRANSSADRGVRVDTIGLPDEALPFVNAVNELLQKLDDAAARQEAFAADVAHELKTPLAIMKLTLDGHDGPFADEIRVLAGSMNRLIEQLLLLAQLNADGAAMTPHEQVSLAAVAKDVTAQLAPVFILDNKNISLDILDDPIVCGRYEAIAAALRNLAENAQRFVPQGGVVMVLVGPGAQVRVRDAGPGITPEQLERLKTRHQRADSGSATGAGLGLEIVSKIMAAHGGFLKTRPDLKEIALVFGSGNASA